MEGSKFNRVPNYDVMVRAQTVRPVWERRLPTGIFLGESSLRSLMFRIYSFLLVTDLFLATLTFQLAEAETQAIPTTKPYINESVMPWKNLKPSPEFSNTDGLQFFRLRTDNGSTACLVVLDLKDGKYNLKPFFNSPLRSTSSSAQVNGALVAVNGGYFNLSDGESTSYVVIDDKNQCQPKTNRALLENPELKPYLERIFRRNAVEIFRVGAEGLPSRTDVTITDNFAKSQLNQSYLGPFKLIHSSLQAGPRLLPVITENEEAFVRKDSTGKLVDAIGSHRLAARTAFGITADAHALILCIASKGQNEFSSGVTLAQLANILKILGCSDAINFDGGTSTTMVIRRHAPESIKGNDGSPNQYLQVCGRTPEKLVKSGLMILPVSQ